MFVEVYSESADVRIFPLKDRLLFGSGEICDVTIPVPGISRKHLLLMREGEELFVVDQGSTNGSYLEEERIRPGLRMKINPHLPVRLSGDVLIRVVEEASGPIQEVKKAEPERMNQDATTVFSLKELKAAEEKLEEKKKKIRQKLKDKRPVKKKRSFTMMDAMNIIIGALVCILVYLFYRK